MARIKLILRLFVSLEWFLLKCNNFDLIDLSRFETGFFEPEMNFDALDNIITETVDNPIESADVQNNQNLHETQSSTRLNVIFNQ